jgi:hypothetical protein
MVGAVERDEALRVPRGQEDLAQDQQRLAERCDPLAQRMRREVLEQLAADPERPSRQHHLGRSVAADRVERAAQQPLDVRRP